MKEPVIDETKLPEIMKIIDEAASLMELKDCESNEVAKNELTVLQNRLCEITGNKKIEITNFQDYWGATDLDTLTDYIFYPDLVGLDRNAPLEQIADKIIVVIQFTYDMLSHEAQGFMAQQPHIFY